MNTPTIESMPELDDLLKEEFKIGGTSFVLDKVPASQGLGVLHIMRMSLGDALSTVPADDTNAWGRVLMQWATQLPIKQFDEIKEVLFKHVRFSNATAKHQQMSYSEDEACSDAFQIMEVWLRALMFNFLPALLATLSRFGLADPQSS